MERERWLEVSRAVGEVAGRWREGRPYGHPTALVARVYLWAAAHDRPVSWACDARNWDRACRPAAPLPSQPTMSRRARRADFRAFLDAVGRRLAGRPSRSLLPVLRVDGKPLPVAAHSTDRDAAWGRGAGGPKARGYKLHAVWGDRPMPEQWRVTPLDAVERDMARRMLKRLGGGGGGGGYLLGDGHFDASRLHDDAAAAAGLQLVAPRQHPGAGLGHHYQSPRRLRAIAMLEVPPAAGGTGFGPALYAHRRQVERDFGNLCSHGGGLTCLPPWVRRPWRVRAWVHAKLLLNAGRIRCLRRRKKEAPRE